MIEYSPFTCSDHHKAERMIEQSSLTCSNHHKAEKMIEQSSLTCSNHHKAKKMIKHSPFTFSNHQQGGENTQSLYLFRINKAEKMIEYRSTLRAEPLSRVSLILNAFEDQCLF